MKAVTRSILFFWLVLIVVAPSMGADSSYSTSANRAVSWLSSHQNSDGSWGATDDVKLLYTVEAVMALRAVSQRTAAYFAGIAWLENHCAPNVDYEARRILALSPHGDNVQTDQTYVQTAQMLTLPGNSGWGLTGDYQGAPLDSAVALLAWGQLGLTTNVSPALNYLKGAQIAGSDSGWAVAQEIASDPVTTAFVLQALTAYKSMDSSLSTTIAYGVSALLTKVSGSSPTHVQGLAALAYSRAGYASNATTLLNVLSSSQSTDGSWSQDIYSTAICARAMAAVAGIDTSSLATPVYFVDPNLRAAINKALGKDSMDILTRGDMANLTSLAAENMGISDLTGMEWAVNLTYADLKNNNINSIAPLSALPNLTSLDWTGNPGNNPPDAQAVPAMSMPVMLLTIFLLAGFLGVSRKRKSPTVWVLFAVMSLLLTNTAYSIDSNGPRKAGLEAEEVQQIQAVGQAVLATRRAEPQSQVMEQLRQRLDDLRQAVASPGVRLGKDTVISIQGNAVPSGKTQKGQLQSKGQAALAIADKHIRNALEQVRKQRAAVELDIEESVAEKDHTFERNAVAKVQELEDEVEKALQSPVEERKEKLRILQERLEIKHLTPLRPEEVTPTIRTIVRHKEQ